MENRIVNIYKGTHYKQIRQENAKIKSGVLWQMRQIMTAGMWGKKCATVQVYGRNLLVLEISQLGCTDGLIEQYGNGTGDLRKWTGGQQYESVRKVYGRKFYVSQQNNGYLYGCTVFYGNII